MKYRNKHRSFSRTKRSSCGGSYLELREVNRGRAFAGLSGNIESAVERGETMFNLSTLHTSFEQRLEELGHSIAVNKTRLNEELLGHFCNYGLQKQPHGKYCVLVFPAGLQEMLGAALEQRNM